MAGFNYENTSNYVYLVVGNPLACVCGTVLIKEKTHPEKKLIMTSLKVQKGDPCIIGPLLLLLMEV